MLGRSTSKEEPFCVKTWVVNEYEELCLEVGEEDQAGAQAPYWDGEVK